jgi:hypothetical protein
MGGDLGADFDGRETVRSFCAAVDACVNDCAGDLQKADAHFSFARGVVTGCCEELCRWVQCRSCLLCEFGRNEGVAVWRRDALECFVAYLGEIDSLLGGLVRA